MTTQPASLLLRRRVLRAAGALPLALAWPAAAASLSPTPAQTEGPFYPTRLPLDTDNDLVQLRGAEAQALGMVTHVSGRVLDTSGKPIPGARVEIWQCDHQGIYDHPRDSDLERRDRAFQGFGQMLTSANGTYKFRTIRPVPYTGRTPHIHTKVFAPDGRRLTTQMYVAGDPGNERDSLFRGIPPRLRERVLLKLEPANGVEQGALAGSLDIVLG
jgi:protocatechuate 3,4-dioxygenase beta subunit